MRCGRRSRRRSNAPGLNEDHRTKAGLVRAALRITVLRFIGTWKQLAQPPATEGRLLKSRRGHGSRSGCIKRGHSTRGRRKTVCSRTYFPSPNAEGDPKVTGSIPAEGRRKISAQGLQKHTTQYSAKWITPAMRRRQRSKLAGRRRGGWLSRRDRRSKASRNTVRPIDLCKAKSVLRCSPLGRPCTTRDR